MGLRPSKGIAIAGILAIGMAASAPVQERFSFFLASDPESVTRMLTLAELRDDDVVVDLGSGDGLIPLTAARLNSRLRARGVDIDSELVTLSNRRAKSDGLADRVRFEYQNAFDADLRDATVVTMWLYPDLMRLLRPVILERARPGTRVLTSTWDLGNWRADRVSTDEGRAIYLWIVPARVAGGWQWQLDVAGRRLNYAAVLEQQFQAVEGVARAGDRREVLHSLALQGDDLTFGLSVTLDGLGLTRHEFRGKVDEDSLVGRATLTPSGQSAVTLPFRARRTKQSHYFGPTGTALFSKPGPPTRR